MWLNLFWNGRVWSVVIEFGLVGLNFASYGSITNQQTLTIRVYELVYVVYVFSIHYTLDRN